MTCTSWVALHDMAHSFIELYKAVVHELVQGNAKECSNYRTMVLISHASRVMLKILQARLQQYVNRELQMFKLVLEKAEEPEIKLLTSAGC